MQENTPSVQIPGAVLYWKQTQERRKRTMGYKIRNFIGSEGNDDIHVADQKGSMTAFYYDRDLSVMPWKAQTA